VYDGFFFFFFFFVVCAIFKFARSTVSKTYFVVLYLLLQWSREPSDSVFFSYEHFYRFFTVTARRSCRARNVRRAACSLSEWHPEGPCTAGRDVLRARSDREEKSFTVSTWPGHWKFYKKWVPNLYRLACLTAPSCFIIRIEVRSWVHRQLPSAEVVLYRTFIIIIIYFIFLSPALSNH